MILMVKKLLERFTKRIAKHKSKRVEKVINRKGHKLYVKWKGYAHSFSSWFDKKEIV